MDGRSVKICAEWGRENQPQSGGGSGDCKGGRDGRTRVAQRGGATSCGNRSTSKFGGIFRCAGCRDFCYARAMQHARADTALHRSHRESRVFPCCFWGDRPESRACGESCFLVEGERDRGAFWCVGGGVRAVEPVLEPVDQKRFAVGGFEGGDVVGREAYGTWGRAVDYFARSEGRCDETAGGRRCDPRRRKHGSCGQPEVDGAGWRCGAAAVAGGLDEGRKGDSVRLPPVKRRA